MIQRNQNQIRDQNLEGYPSLLMVEKRQKWYYSLQEDYQQQGYEKRKEEGMEKIRREQTWGILKVRTILQKKKWLDVEVFG